VKQRYECRSGPRTWQLWLYLGSLSGTLSFLGTPKPERVVCTTGAFKNSPFFPIIKLSAKPVTFGKKTSSSGPPPRCTIPSANSSSHAPGLHAHIHGSLPWHGRRRHAHHGCRPQPRQAGHRQGLHALLHHGVSQVHVPQPRQLGRPAGHLPFSLFASDAALYCVFLFFLQTTLQPPPFALQEGREHFLTQKLNMHRLFFSD
jgi:hypothetical protein